MITDRDKQRLIEQQARDPGRLRAAAFKCAAGLAVIALIAVVGVQSHWRGTNPDAAQQAAARTSAAVADSQQQLEARRQRFERSAQSRGVRAAPLRGEEATRAEPAADEPTLLRRTSD